MKTVNWALYGFTLHSHIASWKPKKRRCACSPITRAIAYENARLHEQLNTARETARLVAEVTALEELQTLQMIVTGIRNLLECDIVTLYVYRDERDVFDFPPAVAGEINTKIKSQKQAR